ncbi:protein-L-isoaspartate(D-aspartate) O-methyltransferase [Alkalimarinus coralli]|uniref:protein-L-isoaspartate(D-aspartate) O-methyltransferase n=1 Tax=Alkalimarinus coralli TaxID=2935863 RepID=UPI003519A366
MRETQRYTGRCKLKEDVKQALRKVDRSSFVPHSYKSMAWQNHPLSIGCEQTISQPFIVALMTDLLDVKTGQRVLEIGTGSGYQTAILAQLAGQVYTVERIATLAQRAKDVLTGLSLSNIQFKVADGYDGWSEYAPFDAIVVTAAPDDVPQSLVDQLIDGGRIVMPVGSLLGGQSLIRGVKEKGELIVKDVLPVSFVPMVGGVECF